MLTNGAKETHPLVQNCSLQLAAWTILGNPYLIQDYQKRLPLLSLVQEDEIRVQIMTLPGESGLAGVLNDRLIRFNSL